MIGYKLADLQNLGRYFCDGILFSTKQEVLDSLLDFHNSDFNDEVYADYEDYFKVNNINTTEAQLNEMLSFGNWELEEVDIIRCKECNELYEINEGHRCWRI